MKTFSRSRCNRWRLYTFHLLITLGKRISIQVPHTVHDPCCPVQEHEYPCCWLAGTVLCWLDCPVFFRRFQAWTLENLCNWAFPRVFLSHMNNAAGGSALRCINNSTETSGVFRWGGGHQAEAGSKVLISLQRSQVFGWKHFDTGVSPYHQKLSHIRLCLLCVCHHCVLISAHSEIIQSFYLGAERRNSALTLTFVFSHAPVEKVRRLSGVQCVTESSFCFPNTESELCI